VSVAFVPPASNGGSVITNYTVTSNPEGRTATGPSSPLTVTGLTNGISYTFTVVATNAVGNSVASTASSAVIPSFSCGTSIVSDIDGNNYNTVLIGTQCWLKENLKTSRFRNGGSITNVTTPNSIWTTGYSTPSWCYYDNNSSNNAIYGKIYNWITTQGDTLCPTGWKVPTDAEWTTLIQEFDNLASATAYITQSNTAGGKLKSTETNPNPVYGWNSPNTGATNESGFSALPGGYRSDGGIFVLIRDYAFFWSASNGGPGGGCWYRSLEPNNGKVNRVDFSGSAGASVRCLKN
jgi:uncharacterized protein (TIGR02145 family)